jgi:hypothetical protein
MNTDTLRTTTEEEYSDFDKACIEALEQGVTISDDAAPFDLGEVKAAMASGFRVVPVNLSDDELDTWLCGE